MEPHGTDDLDLDLHRARRTGEPEVVLAGPKTPEQAARAVRGLLDGTTGPVLATRCTPEHVDAILEAVPEAVVHHDAGVVVARAALSDPTLGLVVIATGGTSDLRVARECQVTLEAFGCKSDLITDVGVAGVHRVLGRRAQLDEADVVVAVAGMEGALPTVIGALVEAPVIAVPTSVGYGAAFGGLAALLGMLTSCAPGISVVNIDNGFGAALVARRILRARNRPAGDA